MRRTTVKLTVRWTRRVRVRATVRYNVRTMAVARHVVAQARAAGAGLDVDQLVLVARGLWPEAGEADDILDALDAVCGEDAEER